MPQMLQVRVAGQRRWPWLIGGCVMLMLLWQGLSPVRLMKTKSQILYGELVATRSVRPPKNWPGGGAPAFVDAAVLAPDGKSVCSLCASGLEVWTIEDPGSAVELEPADSAAELYGIAWSPDARMIAAYGLLSPVKVYSLETKKKLWSASKALCASWSPDGARLAVVDGVNATVTILDGRTGAGLTTVQTGSPRQGLCTWSPDGDKLFSGGQSAVILETTTWKRTVEVELKDPGIMTVVWSPDSKYLVFGGKQPQFTKTVSTVYDASTGDPVLRVKNYSNPVHTALWTPTARSLILNYTDSPTDYMGEMLEVYGMSTGGVTHKLMGPDKFIYSASWSKARPELLATASSGTAIEVWKWDLAKAEPPIP